MVISRKQYLKNWRKNKLKEDSNYWNRERVKTYNKHPEKYTLKYFQNKMQKFFNSNPKYFKIKRIEYLQKDPKYYVKASNKCKENNPIKYTREYFNKANINTREKNSKKYGSGSIYDLIKHLRTRLKNTLTYYTKNEKIMSSNKYNVDFMAIVRHINPTNKNVKDKFINIKKIKKNKNKIK